MRAVDPPLEKRKTRNAFYSLPHNGEMATNGGITVNRNDVPCTCVTSDIPMLTSELEG